MTEVICSELTCLKSCDHVEFFITSFRTIMSAYTITLLISFLLVNPAQIIASTQKKSSFWLEISHIKKEFLKLVASDTKRTNIDIAAERIQMNMRNKLNSPKWTKFVDKLALKNYAKTKGVPTIPTIQIYEKEDKIDFKKLPSSFILKSNKGSGRNLIVRNNKIINSTGGIKHRGLQGKNINDPYIQKKLRVMIKEWRKPYSYKELQYEYTQPRVFQEKFITTSFVDVKYYVARGKPTVIQMTEDIASGDNKLYFYNTNFDEIECPSVDYQKARFDIEEYKKHKNTFDRYVKLLSEDIDLDFYRIDFLVMDNTVVLSEITLSPMGGAGLKKLPLSKCDTSLLE